MGSDGLGRTQLTKRLNRHDLLECLMEQETHAKGLANILEAVRRNGTYWITESMVARVRKLEAQPREIGRQMKNLMQEEDREGLWEFATKLENTPEDKGRYD